MILDLGSRGSGFNSQNSPFIFFVVLMVGDGVVSVCLLARSLALSRILLSPFA